MPITCREAIQVPSLKKLELVAGEAGLDKIVRWVHYFELPQITSWVLGGELLFMSGVTVRNTLDLIQLVTELANKNVAGLVIYHGVFIIQTPQEVIDLANTLDFPLFQLSWDVKLVEVTKEICNLIINKENDEEEIEKTLKDFLFNSNCNHDMLKQKLALYGHDLSKPYRAIIVRIKNFDDFLPDCCPNPKPVITNYMEQIRRIILNTISRYHTSPLSLFWQEMFYILMPVKKTPQADLEFNLIIANEFFCTLHEKYPELMICAGIGGVGTGLKELNESVHQAEATFKLDRNTTICKIYAYEHLGLYRQLLLINEELLYSIFRETIMPLTEYDSYHKTDLVRNLEIFLECNGNLEIAAKNLFLHRNTLVYRLKKIEKLTGKSLDEIENLTTFYLGLLIKNYINIS